MLVSEVDEGEGDGGEGRVYHVVYEVVVVAWHNY